MGRDASSLDWIGNSLGTLGGALLAVWLGVLLRPRRRTATYLAAGALLFWGGVLLLGAWGIQPSPSPYSYWGQRVPQLGAFAAFRGELLSARVNGVELPPTRIRSDDVDAIRLPLLDRHVRVEAVVRAGPPQPSSEIAPIARIADSAREEILLLGRRRDELVFRLRLRASTLRLQTPAFALARAFGGGASDGPPVASPETLSAILDGSHLELVARRRAGVVASEFELNPAVAWSFFLPWDYSFGPNASWLSQLWIAALLLPVGYWTAMMAPAGEHRVMLAATVLVFAIQAIISAVFGFGRAQASQYLCEVAGVALGWMASASVARGGVSVESQGSPSS